MKKTQGACDFFLFTFDLKHFEFYQQQVIPPLGSWENQAYSAITDVMSYGSNDSPVVMFSDMQCKYSTFLQNALGHLPHPGFSSSKATTVLTD